MLDRETIDYEIQCLENEDTDFDTCEKLAILYTVRDHIGSNHDKFTEKTEGSEFLTAASDVDWYEFMNILDEHMDSLKIVAPKAYSSVMAKIRRLK